MSETTTLYSTLSGASYSLHRSFRAGRLLLYEAADNEGRNCWVKQVSADDDQAIMWLRYEAIIRDKLHHSGLNRLLDRGRSRACFFLVFEPAVGRPLSYYIERAPLDFTQTWSVACQLAELLDYLHGQGIICRALPPSVFYLDSLGHLMLADLGSAWDEVSPPRSGDQSLDATYLSPEEAGGHAAERRSDIYSYGLLLFELLAGRPPFWSTNRGDLALQHLLVAPPDLQIMRLNVPIVLSTLVKHCLAKAPDDRPASAAAVLATLREHWQAPAPMREASAIRVRDKSDMAHINAQSRKRITHL